ncbi:MAG: hypothetical protein AAF311_07245 [Pseudomonadota bacterium]
MIIVLAYGVVCLVLSIAAMIWARKLIAEIDANEADAGSLRAPDDAKARDQANGG